MGGFYGSVQVQGVERDVLKEVASNVARERGIKCLLGPEINGWIGIYPENHGQDTTVGAEIAARVSGIVLHLLVHDDDILAYELWRQGEPLDSYWSRPGYFGDENLAEEEAQSGQPELLSSLFGADADRLRTTLARDESITFESERLEVFADLLGISNAVTSYEYLQGDERDNVQGWKQFELIPADVAEAEKKTKQTRRKQLTAERNRMKREGLLLVEKRWRNEQVRVCPAANGFLALHGNHRKTTAEVYQPPWNGMTTLSNITTSLPAIVTNASASLVAMPFPQQIDVYSTESWERTTIIPAPEGCVPVAMSDDGSRLAYCTPREVVVCELRNGRESRFSRPPVGRAMAFHPSGDWLVLAESELTFIPLTSGANSFSRAISNSEAAEKGAAAWQAMFRSVDVEKLESETRGHFERELHNMEKQFSSGKLKMTEKEFTRFKNNYVRSMEQALEGQRELRKSIAENGELPRAFVAKESIISLGVSGDGRWLWCGTDKGLRVFDWSTAVMEPTETMPDAVHAFEAAATSETGLPRGCIYTTAEQIGADAILFGGLSGALCRMDLQTGQVEQLLALPEQAALFQVVCSADGAAIGTVSSPGFPDVTGRGVDCAVWAIWSAEELLRRRSRLV